MKPLNSLGILGRIGAMVYQRTAPGKGNIPNGGLYDLQCRAHVPHTNPNTLKQQRYRARFRAGVAAWHAATPQQRDEFNQRASKRALSGFNLWMSDFLRSA